MSAISIIILTAALVVVTWWYARHTKRIAEIMTKDYETRISPLLDVRQGGGTRGFPEAKTSLLVKNLGSYVAFVKNQELRLYMPDRPENSYTRPLQTDEIALFPNSDWITLPVNIAKNDIANLGIDITPGKYHFGVHIKATLEMEVAGADKNFKLKSYQMF